MTTLHNTATAPFGAISIFRGVTAISNTFETVSNWNMARNTRKSLSKLSNLELDDIGLSRGDIDAITASWTRPL